MRGTVVEALGAACATGAGVGRALLVQVEVVVLRVPGADGVVRLAPVDGWAGVEADGRALLDVSPVREVDPDGVARAAPDVDGVDGVDEARGRLVQSEVVRPRLAGGVAAGVAEAGVDWKRDAEEGGVPLVPVIGREGSGRVRFPPAKAWPRAGGALGVCRMAGCCAFTRWATMLLVRAGAFSCGR